MIVLDNSVLSAYIRLNLLSELHALKTEIYITPEIVSEYSVKWIEKLPDWVLIKKTKYNILKGISNLSESDHSVINLSIELNCQLASDDLEIRKISKENAISVTGSLGILKSMYLKNVITDKQRYLVLINELSKDVYLSDDLIDWALNVD